MTTPWRQKTVNNDGMRVVPNPKHPKDAQTTLMPSLFTVSGTAFLHVDACENLPYI